VTDQTWEAVRDTVRAHTGLTLPPTMRSIIARTLLELRIEDAARQLRDVAVRERFFDRVFIGTTWFAREQIGIDALVSALAPLARRRADGAVHVWSAGCSTGQEPYALAMALTDAGCRPRILATDFHQPSLRIAREGSYAASRVPAHWRRYFDVEANGNHRVIRAIRDCVRFERHNFATDAPPAHQLDAVVCRNVLIYFERADAIAAIGRLVACCRDGGFLLLGALEAPLLWMSVNDPRFGSASAPLVELSAACPLRTPVVRPVRPQVPSQTATRRQAPETSAALVRSRALEQAGQLHDALRVLDRPTVTAPLDAAARLARGLLLKQLGRLDEAIQELRAARFLDPESWLAPYQLAACLERGGEPEEALEAYRHTAAAIDSGGRSGLEPPDDSIEVLAASAAAACRRKLGGRARTQPPTE
jgi:chemotaxis protein methyltransferase CheR